MSIITVSNLRKTYKFGKQIFEAVKGIEFSIDKGEFAAITGPSGSGKSTILNIIGLIDIPSAGSVIINDNDIYKDYDLTKINSSEIVSNILDRHLTSLRRSQIGHVFQTFNLIPVLNVYENIEFPLLLKTKEKTSETFIDNLSKKEKREWIEYVIEKVGLKEYISHKATELSGGQCQRVAIARALITKPPIVLADEPTANLDSENSKQILTLMKKLNNDTELQTTFVFSTHDSRIVAMSNHVIHLLDGYIIKNEYKNGVDSYFTEET